MNNLNLTEKEINQIINAEEIRSLGDTLVYVDEVEYHHLSSSDYGLILDLLDEKNLNYKITYFDLEQNPIADDDILSDWDDFQITIKK